MREYLAVYLPMQRTVSSNTVKSYKETMNLYLQFLCNYGKQSLKDLSFNNISSDSINAFLEWLDTERHCGLTTLNQPISRAGCPTKNRKEINR
ncbi:site-specific integrase [Desulfitibacter alkalitolerans]|uniref:site-specific integrase n=1 Tax=Desulfitibacter alkalitolerans TaxID=264641 RepID=UPI003BF5E421